MSRSPILDRCFRRFNCRYFKGALYCRVEWSATLFRRGLLGEIDFSSVPYTVRLSDRLKFSPVLAKIILLHELVHAATWFREKPDHGPKFKRRIRKLFKDGAYEGLL